MADSRANTATTKTLQQQYGWHCVEKCKGCIFIYGVSGKLWFLTGALLHFLNIMTKYMYFPLDKNKKLFKNKFGSSV